MSHNYKESDAKIEISKESPRMRGAEALKRIPKAIYSTAGKRSEASSNLKAFKPKHHKKEIDIMKDEEENSIEATFGIR